MRSGCIPRSKQKRVGSPLLGEEGDSMAKSEREVRYEVRREAASVVVVAVALLGALALLSYRNGWELVEVPWWSWLVLAVPGLVLCVDLWLGSRRVGIAGTRVAALALLVVIVQGNVVGVCLLVAALVTTSGDDLGGGQLLFTTAAIWMANVVVFGLCYWDLDDGGPFERARRERSQPDFRFPQDETPEIAPPDWRPRVWDYVFVALTSASAFSPTDTMPLTLKAKLLVGTEEVVSLVLIVLVTARAVSVLGT
jgi:hypothetical protein